MELGVKMQESREMAEQGKINPQKSGIYGFFLVLKIDNHALSNEKRVLFILLKVSEHLSCPNTVWGP